MSWQARMQALRENPETSAAGTKWSKEEEENLLKEMQSGKTIAECAKEHKRTEVGILSRLKQIACTMVLDGKSVDEVVAHTGLTAEAINDACLRQKNKKSPTHKAQKVASTSTSNNDQPSAKDLLKEIRDILLRMEARMSPSS